MHRVPVLRAAAADDAAAVAALLRAREQGDLVAVHPGAVGRGVGATLREAAERQARARGVRLVRQFTPAANTPARVHLLEAGWWPVHHYFRMRIDRKDVPPRPAALARVVDRAADAEAVWHLIEGAHSDVEGHLPQSFEAAAARAFEAAGPRVARHAERCEKVLGV